MYLFSICVHVFVCAGAYVRVGWKQEQSLRENKINS